jgi:hypothetical protein
MQLLSRPILHFTAEERQNYQKSLTVFAVSRIIYPIGVMAAK